MHNWHTINKYVGCILNLPSVDMQVVDTYDELMTHEKFRIPKSAFEN